MLILIGLVIEGSIQVRSVHGAPNQWIVKYATSEWMPPFTLQEEGEFSFTVPADSPYSTPYSDKVFNSTANGKVKYDLKTVYPPWADHQCTGKYSIPYTSSVSVRITPVQGNDSTQVVRLDRISGTEPKIAFYTWNCVSDDGETWQPKDEVSLPYVNLCRGGNVIMLPLKDGATFKEVKEDPNTHGGNKCEVTIHGTANQKPIADAGPDQVVMTGNTVILNADGSYDPDGDSITYSWSQTGGPSVSLSNPRSPNPTFVAPEIPDSLPQFTPASLLIKDGLIPVSPQDPITRLIFSLTVNDGGLTSAPSNAGVTVLPPCKKQSESRTDPPVPKIERYDFTAKDLEEADTKTNKFMVDGKISKAITTPELDPKVVHKDGKIICAVVKSTITTKIPNWTNLGKETSNNCAIIKSEWKRVMDIIDSHEKQHRDAIPPLLENAHKEFVGMPTSQFETIRDGLVQKMKDSEKKVHEKAGHDVSVRLFRCE
jgi:predicted secreted Zn-dependent protease